MSSVGATAELSNLINLSYNNVRNGLSFQLSKSEMFTDTKFNVSLISLEALEINVMTLEN